MSYHPNIDAREIQYYEDLDGVCDPMVEAVFAIGSDIAAQLGRLADHFDVEQVVSEARRFGEYPAGVPSIHQHFNDPNISTRDEADVALAAAVPAE